jgi:hypothetical protein
MPATNKRNNLAFQRQVVALLDLSAPLTQAD